MLSLKTVLAMAGPMAVHALSGEGHSTRYWDCCKTSCAWSGKADVSAPVLTCDANDNPISDADAKSGCDGGGAYACTNNSPWEVNEDLAFGFAATALIGGSEDSWCCACYALTFTTGPVAGKTMVVQSTNTGGDLSNNHFDIQMPGGGLGIFDGCTPQFGSSIPGERYGGVTSRSQCDQMPELLKDGCYWRFDWFQNADNPDFTFEQVQCPKAITDVSGCTRSDDGMFPVFDGASKPAPGGEETAKPSSTTKVAPEATNPPDANQPANPPPVDETDNGVEKPEEEETVEPVEEDDETTTPIDEEEEIVDEEEDTAEEDCEEENEEIIEEDDEEEVIDEDEDCEEDNEEIIEEDEEDQPIDDEEDCEEDGEIIEEGEDEESEAVEEDEDEDEEEIIDGCPAPAPTPAPQPGAEAALYGQCGGINWTGPTKCGEGAKCEHWNPYYFQCIAA